MPTDCELLVSENAYVEKQPHKVLVQLPLLHSPPLSLPLPLPLALPLLLIRQEVVRQELAASESCQRRRRSSYPPQRLVQL